MVPRRAPRGRPHLRRHVPLGGARDARAAAARGPLQVAHLHPVLRDAQRPLDDPRVRRDRALPPPVALARQDEHRLPLQPGLHVAVGVDPARCLLGVHHRRDGAPPLRLHRRGRHDAHVARGVRPQHGVRARAVGLPQIWHQVHGRPAEGHGVRRAHHRVPRPAVGAHHRRRAAEPAVAVARHDRRDRHVRALPRGAAARAERRHVHDRRGVQGGRRRPHGLGQDDVRLGALAPRGADSRRRRRRRRRAEHRRRRPLVPRAARAALAAGDHRAGSGALQRERPVQPRPVRRALGGGAAARRAARTARGPDRQARQGAACASRRGRRQLLRGSAPAALPRPRDAARVERRRARRGDSVHRQRHGRRAAGVHPRGLRRRDGADDCAPAAHDHGLDQGDALRQGGAQGER
mmetsp:Transcript_2005/g.5217  ORF Transcript_2005/g.5217 Transcript_2005/m.5217 type:complete len:407 (-) Transcript_2005:437-1657(-)